jgi:hypothetical protein
MLKPALFAMTVAFAAVGGAQAQGLSDARSASVLREQALADTTAWSLVESLTTEIGPRPAGSPAMVRARDWGMATLTRLGFKNVRAEPFVIESWQRGSESLVITGPNPQSIALLGLGRSAPTPAAGIEAQIVVFKTYADLLAAPLGSLNGKIAVAVQPMLRTQDGSGYGAVNAMRTQGASEAAKRGAVAYLLRSLSTDDTRLPHAGSQTYAPNVPKIPSAAISTPDAEQLERLAARGPVTVKLTMASTTRMDAEAWNVVGELPGATDEVVMIGGHLDSWDGGTGAIDNGTGIAISVASARLAAQTPRKRTIRVVMFGAEEMNQSGPAYARAHAGDLNKIVLVGESDSGPGRIWTARLPAGVARHPSMASLAAQLAPLKVPVSADAATTTGTDTAPLLAAGVPGVSLRTDQSRYFDLHHSADDTLDKVNPADLAQNVAAWSLVLAAAADADINFRSPGPAQ